MSETSAPSRRYSLLRSSFESGLIVHDPSPGAHGPSVHVQVPQQRSPILHPPLTLIGCQELRQLFAQQHLQGLHAETLSVLMSSVTEWITSPSSLAIYIVFVLCYKLSIVAIEDLMEFALTFNISNRLDCLLK